MAKRKRITSTQKVASLTLGEKIKKVLVAYFTTQFILMIFVGLATWGILTLLHVKYAILLGIFTGVLSTIPNFGMILASVAATLVALLDGVNMWSNSPQWLEGLIVLAIFFTFNKFVDLILAPIFLGKTTKANPFIIFLVVLAGTIFFGIWGAILSVPLFLVVKTIVGDLANRK